MGARQTLPNLWLLSDQRNDVVLEAALARLPAGSGLVFRHYHLGTEERRARFEALRALCSARGHLAILAGDAANASAWGADGSYGPPHDAAVHSVLLRLATAHDAAEIELAHRNGADAIVLSPVFPTRSHPGAPALGKAGFLALARSAALPVIALGGMTAERAAEIGWPRWAAIDGLS